MTETELKTLIVTNIKQLPGGPAGISQGTRGRGLVAILYAFIEFIKAVAGGTIRDPFDVPAAKRKAVVDAGVAAVPEPDDAYYGCEFVDEVYGPSQPAYYKCMPSAPASTGGATVWKWFRLDIL